MNTPTKALYYNKTKYRVIRKSVKHFKNSQQINYSTDHDISYADREKNSPSLYIYTYTYTYKREEVW